MIARRDLLIAGLAVGAAAAAEGLRPRKRLVLLQNGTIDQAIPMKMGRWTSQTAPGLIGPDLAGKLAQTLYSEMLQRIYTHDETGASVMLLAAYGDTQSDLLQLHRPEACYPAVGFSIKSTVPADLTIAPGAILPGRRVVAVTESRHENIFYWARLGEQLPQSAGQQREARFENAVRGYLADGILVRSSVIGESAASFRVLDEFVPTLLQAVSRATRPALLGTKLASQMQT